MQNDPQALGGKSERKKSKQCTSCDKVAPSISGPGARVIGGGVHTGNRAESTIVACVQEVGGHRSSSPWPAVPEKQQEASHRC